MLIKLVLVFCDFVCKIIVKVIFRLVKLYMVFKVINGLSLVVVNSDVLMVIIIWWILISIING